MVPEGDLAIGSVLDGRYVLERKLGGGGSGNVWLANDPHGTLHGRVAIKVILESIAKNPQFRDRFVREAAVLERLDHANIIRGLGFGSSDEALYIVMEFVEGKALSTTLIERARLGAPLSIDEVSIIFQQICAAVRTAHEHQIIHRDLKPANVMVLSGKPEYRLKVVDFGLAKLADGSAFDATTLGRTLGSFLYMSPEQALGQAVDHRTDIFALGGILFELLTLRRAWARDEQGAALPFGVPVQFEGNNAFARLLHRFASEPRHPPSRYESSISPELDEVVLRALAHDKKDRFASADELALAFLTAIQGERAMPAEPDTVPEVAPPTAIVPSPIFLDPELSRDTPVIMPAATAIAPARVLSAPAPRRRDLKAMFPLLALALFVSAAVLGVALVRKQPTFVVIEARPEPRVPVQIAPAVAPIPVPVLVRSSSVAREPEVHEQTKRRQPITRRPVAPFERASSPDALASLHRRLESLKLDPQNLAELTRLQRDLTAEIDRLPDAALKARLKRLAYSSATIGDLAGLEDCLRRLEAARR